MRMPLSGLEEARLIERVNRFVARIIWRGEEVVCHVPNTGRMRELMFPNAKLGVLPYPEDGRATRCKLVLVQREGEWVCIESVLANRFMELLLQSGEADFGPVQDLCREVPLDGSRLDISYRTGERRTWMEVKCCTLVEGGHARFPDAPTVRGAKHLRELVAVRQRGEEAIAAFLVTRHAVDFTANAATDPHFARALLQAHRAGVAIRAFACHVELDGIQWLGEIPCLIKEEWA